MSLIDDSALDFDEDEELSPTVSLADEDRLLADEDRLLADEDEYQEKQKDADNTEPTFSEDVLDVQLSDEELADFPSVETLETTDKSGHEPTKAVSDQGPGDAVGSDGSEVERARSSADPSQRQTNGSSPFRNPGSRNHHQQQKRVGSGFRGRGTRGAAVQQHRHRSNPAQNWRHSRTAAFPGRARFMGHRMGSVAPRPMAGFGRFPRAVPNTAQFRPQPVMGPPVPLRPAMHWNMKGPVEGAQWSRAEARGQLLACQQPPNLEGAAGGGVEGVSYSLPPSDLQTAAFAELHRQLPPPITGRGCESMIQAPPLAAMPASSRRHDPFFEICNEFIRNNQRSLYSQQQQQQNRDSGSRYPRSRSPPRRPQPDFSPPPSHSVSATRRSPLPNRQIEGSVRRSFGSERSVSSSNQRGRSYSRSSESSRNQERSLPDNDRARPQQQYSRSPAQQKQQQRVEEDESEEMLRYRLEYEAELQKRKRQVEAVQKVKELKRMLRVAEADARMNCGDKPPEITAAPVTSPAKSPLPRTVNGGGSQGGRPGLRAKSPKPSPPTENASPKTRKVVYRIRKDSRGQPIQKFELDPVTREVIREVPLVRAPVFNNKNTTSSRRIVLSSTKR